MQKTYWYSNILLYNNGYAMPQIEYGHVVKVVWGIYYYIHESEGK